MFSRSIIDVIYLITNEKNIVKIRRFVYDFYI